MSKKSHARLILHGKAADREDVRQAVSRLRSRGHDVSVRVTWEANDARHFVTEALADAHSASIDTLIAGGGDGTLNEVVAAAHEEAGKPEDIPFAFGLLPLGTANDFARGVGLDPANIAECLWIAATAQARSTDIGLANGRPFVNVATGGFGTRVTTETDPRLKKLLGGAAYLFTGLQRFSELAASSGRLSSPELTWEGDFLAFAVGNGTQAGGGVQLCPDARLDDGLLDVTVLPSPKAEDVPDILRVLAEEGMQGMKDHMVTARVSALTLETAEDFQVNLDGEPVHARRLEFSMAPGAIRMRRP
ncbi:lipid kinase YegS [Roseibium sp.]|uniref:lipid kinase YegS n=1 Tax=Roseibium sp. TaxID=1936156 RepID=UPI003A97B253